MLEESAFSLLCLSMRFPPAGLPCIIQIRMLTDQHCLNAVYCNPSGTGLRASAPTEITENVLTAVDRRPRAYSFSRQVLQLFPSRADMRRSIEEDTYTDSDEFFGLREADLWRIDDSSLNYYDDGVWPRPLRPTQHEQESGMVAEAQDEAQEEDTAVTEEQEGEVGVQEDIYEETDEEEAAGEYIEHVRSSKLLQRRCFPNLTPQCRCRCLWRGAAQLYDSNRPPQARQPAGIS